MKRPLKDRPIELSPQKSRLKRVKSTVETTENSGTLFAYGFWKKAAPLPADGTPVKSPESGVELKLALQRCKSLPRHQYLCCRKTLGLWPNSVIHASWIAKLASHF